MFTTIQPNNELSELVAWITEQGYDIELKSSEWGVDISVARKKRKQSILIVTIVTSQRRELQKHISYPRTKPENKTNEI